MTSVSEALVGVTTTAYSLSTNLPPNPSPEVFRDNFINTIKSTLADHVYALAVEGPDGIGKTTLLSQFARENPNTAISLFVSSANRLSYDIDLLQIELCTQVSWITRDKVLRPDEVDTTQLTASYLELQRHAKRIKQTIYFILDGLEELAGSERQKLLQQLRELLPIGIPQFRFIFSGDESHFRSFLGARLAMKSYPLTEFGIEETRALFHAYSLSTEQLSDIRSICRGIPGRLSIVLRALARGMDIDSYIQDPPSEMFEFDWAQVDESNEELIQVLALIAHDRKPHTIADIAEILEVSAEHVSQAVKSLSFLSTDQSGGVRFASLGLMEYAADRLKSRRESVQRRIIRRLMAIPNSSEALLELPEQLENASEFHDLLSFLTPDHILQILERTQTLSHVDDSVSRGYRSAKKLGRESDILRFCLQRSVIAEVAGLNTWDSEVAALTALEREPEAMALVSGALLREDQLQLSCTLAHGIWLKGGVVPSELMEQIRLLVENTDFASLGSRTQDIASKLICMDPDLGATVLGKAKHDEYSSDPEHLFAVEAMKTLSAKPGDLRVLDLIAATAHTQQHKQVISLVETLHLLIDTLGPAEVCSRVRDIQHIEMKLLVLRGWCALHSTVIDADTVAQSALDLALSTTESQIDASFLADISKAHAGAPDLQRREQLIAAIDGVRASGERLGPSIDYVRLNLELARAEADIDKTRAHGRMIETLAYIDSITDLPTKGEAYARYLAAFAVLESTGFDRGEELRRQSSSALESVVLTLESSTADHFRSLSKVIAALAHGNLDTAIDYAKVANTEPRRDLILVEIAKTLLQDSPDVDVSAVVRIHNEIVSTDKRDKVKNLLVARCANMRALSDPQYQELLPILLSAHEINKSTTACHTLVNAMTILQKRGEQSESLYSQIAGRLRERWNFIDAGWLRLNVGFGVARDLATIDRPIADEILTETERLKEEYRLTERRTATAYIQCIQLTIRAFSGLLPKKLDKPDDVSALSALIDVIPSYAERATLWADLSLRASLAGRAELAADIAQHHLQPALNHINKQDRSVWHSVISRVAPGLYRVQPAACLDLLSELDVDSRDIAIWEIVISLIYQRAPSDYFDKDKDSIPEVNKDALLQVENLAKRVSTDWIIYVITVTVADALLSAKNKYSFQMPQREDFSRRFTELANDKLPNQRFITHQGFRIASLSQALRMRKTKRADWDPLIAQADTIDNVSDRAYVLQIIATSLPSNLDELRGKLIDRAVELIERIAWDIDRIDRYIGLAEDIREFDSSLCRNILLNVGGQLKATSQDGSKLQKRLVDLAFHADAELAKRLISHFDDDEAKTTANTRIRMLEMNKTVTSNVSECDTSAKFGKVRGKEIFELGWALTKSLSGRRVQTYAPKEVRNYLDLIAECPLTYSISMFTWYIDNMNHRFARTDQAGTLLIPVFASCVLATQLMGKISGVSMGRLKAAQNATSDVSEGRSVLAQPGTVDEAVKVITNWCDKNLGDEVWIHDYFFSPTDLAWLQMIRTVKPNCRICVMTSRNEQPKLTPGQDLEELYSAAWAKAYDQLPPRAEIVVIGGEIKGTSPIHDRWLISEDRGLRLGTSFNSLGLTRESEISELSPHDVQQNRRAMEKYLNREVREYRGEKLKLIRFWLT